MNDNIYRVYREPLKAHDDAVAENNSGKGRLYAVPGGVAAWSWGGFFWGFIWAAANRIWLIFLPFGLAFVPLVASLIYKKATPEQISAGRGIFLLIMLGCAIALGMKGREWAWQSRRWDGVNHFNRVQQRWDLVGLLVFVPLIAATLWLFVQAFLQERLTQSQAQILARLSLQTAEKVSVQIEQRKSLPKSLAEMGISTTLGDGLGHVEFDSNSGVIRVQVDFEPLKGASLKLMPWIDNAGFVSWRCIGDAKVFQYMPPECQHKVELDLLVFPARLQTNRAVGYADEVAQAVGNYMATRKTVPKTIRDAGFERPLPPEIASIVQNPANGQITVTMNPAPMQGQAFVLVPTGISRQGMTWQCLANQINVHYMPARCRYLANPNYRPGQGR